MKYFLRWLYLIIFFPVTGFAQDSSVYHWQVSSKRIQGKTYELTFTTAGSPGWQLYGPNEVMNEVPASSLEFSDSTIKITLPFKENGTGKKIKSSIFDNATLTIYEGAVTVSAIVSFK